MRQLRLRAVGVAVGLGLSAAGLFFGPLEAAAFTWSIVSSPNVGTDNNYLDGVACVSSSFCTAVGSYDNGSGTSQTLIESFDGTSWSIVPSPNVGTVRSGLGGVACLSSSSCTAVGSYRNGSNLDQTLIESWDGTNWSTVTSPSAGIADYLFGVACTSPSFCTAVGIYVPNENGGPQSLIEAWNGTSWSIVPSPNTESHYNYLDGVACVSSNFCTAVGWYGNGSGTSQTLIEAWNGSNWSIVSSPNGGPGNNLLSGVSCLSSKSCTAVGYESDRTLIESLNGVRWSIVPSPSSAPPNILYGVSCISFKSLKSCTAVGGHAGGQTLIESKKANKWSIVSSPSTGSYSTLIGVACLSSGSCTTVGYYVNNSGVAQTLIESQ